jgi:5-methylcytosine-specific restriction enzyme B
MSRDNTKYNFDGKMNLAKNRLVLEVVKKYVSDNRSITYNELKTIFYDQLQGSIGVIKNEVDLMQWEEGNKETNKRDRRFFTDEEDVIRLENDNVYVCTEWGAGEKENILSFIKYVEKSLHYDIEVVDNFKTQFKQWWFNDNSRKSNGEVYAKNTKESYFRELERLENKIGKNIFNISDIQYLEIILEKLETGDLREYNRRLNNTDPSNGLKQYINFLKTLGTKEKVYIEKKGVGSKMTIKNIILYGAPGVGKTYNYKKLISMIEEGKSEREIFETISKNDKVSLENKTFEAIKKEKRVEFVTFHQSYSYEDFIEGYRPDEDSNNIIRKDGIFKVIADEARINLENSSKSTNEFIEEKKISEIFKEFCEYIADEIIEKSKFDINNTAYIFEVEKDAFRYKGDNWNAHENGLRMKFSDILEFYNKNIQERKEVKDLDNISKLSIQHATYYFKVYELFKKFKASTKQMISVATENKQKNYYIIIDEINRGNISKIFGELITLIEEDKRDKYEITLPYSKTAFKVPSNLYIIATMNSTDKSIATIDIALRRRFTFLKMKPKAELVKDDNAKKLFNALNDFIKEKLSEDYMLGHSYFMNIQNSEELDFVKEYKIKPLLEEYFYTDDESLKKALALLENDVEIAE